MNSALTSFGTFAGIPFSNIAEFASLLVLPFAHEDLAIIYGAYAVVNEVMPLGLVVAAIYGGMVASDFALYGIGAGARRLPWLSRLAVDDRVRNVSNTLKKNLFGLAALCRVVPGVVFVAFVACGWAQVPFRRFVTASLITAAIYLPLMLYLAIAFGDVLNTHVGWWTWPLLFGALVASGYVRQRVFAFRDAGDEVEAEPETSVKAPAPAALIGHVGMPPLAEQHRRVAPAERIPPGLFYAPLVLTWIGFGLRYGSLTLPSAANPSIPTGGMWGESKSDCLLQIGDCHRDAVAAHTVVTRGDGLRSVGADVEQALDQMASSGIEFPVIAKPDIGWHGYGVRLINDAKGLGDYLAQYPCGAKLILQRFVPFHGEAAVLYARMPGESKGRIVSLAFRYYPHVIGDGRSRLSDLIRRDARAQWKARLHLGADPSHRSLSPRDLDQIPARGEVVQIALIGNQRAGGLYRDAGAYISAELEARFDAIAHSMNEFHYGRFDVRFESTASLLRGEGFAIIEVNGIGGEAIDVWDPSLPVREVYRRLIEQQRLLYRIAAGNRARGFAPTSFVEFFAYLFRQERLMRQYPASS